MPATAEPASLSERITAMNDSPIEGLRFEAPLGEVDAICDAFEAAWLGGHEPRIEDFLLRGDASHQNQLLRELLLAEWDLRRRHGQPTELEPYLARFSASNLPLTELWQAWNENGSRAVTDDPASRFEMMRDAARLEEPGRVIDRFKLLEKVGEGGFGIVWAAEQREPVKRRVALKIIKLGMDTRQVVARFEAERQALAFMDHPNIAKVFDAGTTECGRPYFVMELVRGIPITAYCEQERLGIKERLDLFMKVCHAIQHAHQKGIIHRDIKPANILVTLHDGVPVPKVIDFGIAKATQQELTEKTIYTQLQQFIGTPAYMSPEQAEMSGLDIDTRSDIYSLGVLLYELLTGLTPFDAKELVRSGLDEMRRIIREREPLRPSSRLTRQLETTKRSTSSRSVAVDTPRVPHTAIDRDLDWIVMKCLEKDRTRRYDTINGLALDIDRHLKNEPVEARPPTMIYRLRKIWQRNKMICTAASVVFFALTLGLSSAVIGWVQARTQRDAALHARAGEAIQRKRAQANEELAKEERQKAEFAREETRRRAYAAEISAAFHALDENNLGRAIELLNHQIPKPGQEDLRAFEWRLLWQLCQPDDTKSLHEEARTIAISPDGKWLASAGDNIVIREMPSLSVVHIIPQTPNISSLAFSPGGDLLAGCTGEHVTLWRTESWQVERTLPGTRYPAVFSPDGQWLVTGALGPVVDAPGGYRAWSTKTWEAGRFFGGELLRTWVANRAVAFSPNGRLLVTAGHPDGRESGHQFQVWDFPFLDARSNFERFPGRLASAAFASDGKHLLTGSGEGGELLVWNIAEGKIVERLKEHTAWLWAIVCSRDGRTIVTASSDRTLVIWDAATRTALTRLRGHLGQIESVAISPDGRTVISGATDGTIKVWDATSRHDQSQLPDCVFVAGFSSDSRRLVGAGYGTSKLWNLENGAMTTIPLEDYGKLLQDRKYFNFTSASRDAHGIEPQAVFGRTDGLVEVWNLATMSRVGCWRADHDNDDVAAVTFSPDGQFIATSGANGAVILWEAATHREVRRFEPLGGTLMCLTFSPNGQLLAGSENKNYADSRVGLWDVNSGTLLRTLDLEGRCAFSLAFSPDGKLLATAEQNETAQLWDVPSLGLRATLNGHVQPVVSVAFSPDGKTLATAADDCKLKLWNVATQQELATLELSGGCRSVRFSPDGRTLAVGYLLEPDQYIRLWTVPLLEEIDWIKSKPTTHGSQL
jgi:WD40 repeat protein/serine/threonine protein kinase